MVTTSRLWTPNLGSGWRGRTLFVDTFNRPDNASTIGTDWATTSFGGGGTARIESNTCRFAGFASGGMTTVNGLTGLRTNQWAEMDILIAPNTINAPVIALRLTDSNNFYMLRYEGSAGGGSNAWQIFRRVGGTYTSLVSNAEAQPTAPFRIRGEVFGNQLRLYHWVNGWILKASANDPSFAAPGLIGTIFQSGASDPYIDNFACGNL